MRSVESRRTLAIDGSTEVPAGGRGNHLLNASCVEAISVDCRVGRHGLLPIFYALAGCGSSLQSTLSILGTRATVRFPPTQVSLLRKVFRFPEHFGLLHVVPTVFQPVVGCLRSLQQPVGENSVDLDGEKHHAVCVHSGRQLT